MQISLELRHLNGLVFIREVLFLGHNRHGYCVPKLLSGLGWMESCVRAQNEFGLFKAQYLCDEQRTGTGK